MQKNDQKEAFLWIEWEEAPKTIALYKEWGNGSMASFEEKLSNSEIEQIYEYVKWATKK